jgi:hypothetical protein
VTDADQLLAPSLSTLSGRFATICHNYYYLFMTAARLPWARRIRLQQLHQLLSLLYGFSNLGIYFSLKANPNGMKRSHSGTLLAQGTGVNPSVETVWNWHTCSLMIFPSQTSSSLSG